jgi:hypothetical protein
MDSSGALRVEKKISYQCFISGTNTPMPLVSDGNIHSEVTVNFGGSAAGPGVSLMESSFEPYLFRKNGASSNFALIQGQAMSPLIGANGIYGWQPNTNTYTGDFCGVPVTPEDSFDAQLSYGAGWFSRVLPWPTNSSGVPTSGWGAGPGSNTRPTRIIQWAQFAGAGGDYWYLPGTPVWSYNTQAQIGVEVGNLSHDSMNN